MEPLDKTAAHAAALHSLEHLPAPAGASAAAIYAAREGLAQALAECYSIGMGLEHIRVAATAAEAAHTKARNEEVASVAAFHNRSAGGPFGPRILPLDITLQLLLINGLHSHR